MKSIQFNVDDSIITLKWKHIKSGVIRKHTIKEEKRVIYRKELHPTTTVLYLWRNYTEIARGIAICSKEDVFNASQGFYVALDEAIMQALRDEKINVHLGSVIQSTASEKIRTNTVKA